MKLGSRVRSQARRYPSAAGRFYPQDPIALRESVTNLLASVEPSGEKPPKAIIAPHAGYLYSGPIAATAYAQLIPDRDIIRRVVLLGPAHFVHVEGLAAVSSEAFVTPLGEVPVDAEAVRKISSLAHITVRDDVHRPEHSLEVQLPFLQVVLKEFTIVPLVVGEAASAQVAEVVDLLWGGPETRIVISSDLSHYLQSDEARKLDLHTAKAIVRLDPSIGSKTACGQIPIQGLIQSARRRGMTAEILDLRNSGDTAGSSDRVVGYGAFAFRESS